MPTLPPQILIEILNKKVILIILLVALSKIHFFWYLCLMITYQRILHSCHNLLTGKPLSKRLLNYVHNRFPNEQEKKINIEEMLNVVDDYFKTKEFGPSLSNTKGKIIDGIVSSHMPKSVLVVGCHAGYVLLRIMRNLPRSSKVIVIEPCKQNMEAARSLVKMVGMDEQVTFIASEASSVIPNLALDYGVDKFDFIFLNRTKHNEPSHLPLLKLLEDSAGDSKPQTVIIADKVVLLGDPDYLKYVRDSNNYETQYFQMSLEHTSEEIVDGMEKATFLG
uniref:catechol O-methyltransferase n=1 Tax=Ciona intestinalis TaxID=7719 RepID=H2XU46_CIOIN